MKLIDLYCVTLSGLFVCTLNARGDQGSNDVEKRVDSILSQLTLEEKVNYLAGAPPADPTLPNSTSENVPPVPRLGLPELRNTDGPMGVRVNGGTSTRYPANLLLAATWDPERSSNEGIGIGRNARARGFAIWYGPGADMYRVPVGGRNSEYLCGEDPFLGSRMVVAQIRGAQSQGVVATVKHFVANDQEYKRYTINTVVDERTLHEINFPPFEAAVQNGHVGSVMLAYNPADAPQQVGTGPSSVRWSGQIVPPTTGDYVIKFQAGTNTRFYLGGQQIFSNWDQTSPFDLPDLVVYPYMVAKKVHLEVGQPIAVALEIKSPVAYFSGASGVGLGWASLEPPANLRTYDAVVIAAGFDSSYEGNGRPGYVYLQDIGPGTHSIQVTANEK